ncbi:MAG: Uma2 family endonuclease [Planctomycetota bacterium]
MTTHTTSSSQRRLTWDDYVRMPDDGQRREIIDGVPCVSPSPETGHQYSSVRLSHLIVAWMDATNDDGVLLTSPIDVILEDTDQTVTTVQPDLVYLRGFKRPLVVRRGIIGAPDLVVKILSPGHPDHDRVTKRGLYERHTIPEYWIIDRTARTIEVLRLDGAFYKPAGRFGVGDVVTTPLLRGLEIDVASVTRDP